MAQGGTPAPRGPAPARRPASQPPQNVQRAANFSAAQQQDRRAEEQDGSTPLTDSNQLETTQESPLELPARSYTGAEPTEEAGFGEQISSLSEMESQRAREAKMRKTSEQFTGAPSILGGEQVPGTPRRPAQKAPSQTEETSTEPENPVGPEDEIETAGRLATVQAAASLWRNLTSDRETAAQQGQSGEAADAVEREKKWDTTEAALLMGAEVGFPAIVAAGMMNLRVLNKLTFRNFKMVPDISTTKTAFVLFYTCGCCFNCISIMMPVILMFVGGALIAAAVISVVNLVT